MQQIESLWKEFQQLPYPKEGHIDNLDLDTNIAGCVSTFIQDKGVLNDEKKHILKNCVRDLRIHKVRFLKQQMNTSLSYVP